MADLDAELVNRWFDLMDQPSRIPYLQLALTRQERAAFDGGRSALLAALAGEPQSAPAQLDEPAARWLAVYLDGLAAGVGGARAAEDGPPGIGTPLHLVAGLIAAAAAVSGWDAGALRHVSAVEMAHRAGAGAAEEAVTGADLATVAGAAAGVQFAASPVDWWEPLEPGPAATDKRVSVLFARVLHFLEQVCRPDGPTAPLPADAAGWRAACVEMPWTASGHAFLAEITFRVADDHESVDRLIQALRDRDDSVGLWSGPAGAGLHVHTRDAGSAITEIYAVLTPFDLVITSLTDER